MASRYQRLPFDGSRRPGRVMPQATRSNVRQLHAKVRGVVTRDGTALVIRFSKPNHMPFINEVKAIRGWRWVPVEGNREREGGYWTVHFGQIRQVRAAADKHEWIISPAVRAIPDLDPAEVPMLVSVEGEQLVIDGPWRKETSDLLLEADARLDPRTGVWRVPLEKCVDVVLDMREVAKVRFVGNPVEITDRIDHAQYMLTLSRALEPTPGWQVAPTIARDIDSRPFQHGGIEYGWRSPRSFNWATMGAGKTTVALCAVEQTDWTTQGEGRKWALDFLASTQRTGSTIVEPPSESPYPLLIVAPAGLKTNWSREIVASLPHRKAWICDGMRPSMPMWMPEIWICNYDILGLPADGSKPKATSWITFFTDLIKRDMIRSYIVDEGHRCNNPKAQRTVAAIEAAHALPHDATRMLLTGTPVRNGRRHELIPQLEVIGRGGEFGDKRQLKKDARLSRRLRTVCAWRPNPADVLRSLGVLGPDGSPEPVWQPILVDGDAKVMAEYRRAETDFMEVIRDKARAKARELGEDPESAAVIAAMKAASAASLMQVNMLCRLAGQAKIRAAREWVHDFESSGEKLVVFAENIDMMDAISDDGRIPQIRGGVKGPARTLLVDRFQDEAWIDEKDRLQTLVCQVVAAGEGITLTKAYQQLFAQLTWAPGAMDQCAARSAWRMNDPHNVIAHMLVCAGTIDEDRVDVLARKRAAMALVTDGDQRAMMGEESGYGDVFARLLGRALGIKDEAA